jgi:hypothetical protein
MRDLYVARTAEVAGVGRELLEREIGHGPEPVRARAPEPPPSEYFEPPPEEPRPARRRDPRRDPGVRTEWELVRVMLHRPAYVEFIAERVGPQEFHDPTLRAIYARLAAAAADRTVEALAAGLDEDATEALQLLLAEDGGLDTAERTVQDCLAALQLERLRLAMLEIDRQLPLATGTEQDTLMLRKKQLSDEWRSLGGRGWKSFNRSRP